MITDKAVIFVRAYNDMARVYKAGGFNRIEKCQLEKWQEILEIEEQINQKWDTLPVLDFQRLAGKYTRVLAIAVTHDMFHERKAVSAVC